MATSSRTRSVLRTLFIDRMPLLGFSCSVTSSPPSRSPMCIGAYHLSRSHLASRHGSVVVDAESDYHAAQRVVERNGMFMDLTVVGDVVVSGSPRRPAVEPAGPGDSAFGLLKAGDLTIGNLEVPFTESGLRAEKLVAMRAPTTGAAELAELGFDLVSLAMNHAMDYGAAGMRDTVRA